MNTDNYPKKNAKVKQYSPDAIAHTISRVAIYLSKKNNKGKDSRICEILQDIVSKATPLNQSIFIRTFNELITDYDVLYAPLPQRMKTFYMHYWMANSKSKFKSGITKIDDQCLISHAFCLARAFWRAAQRFQK